MFDRCRVADICGRSLTCKYWISINNLPTFRIAKWEGEASVQDRRGATAKLKGCIAGLQGVQGVQGVQAKRSWGAGHVASGNMGFGCCIQLSTEHYKTVE